MSSESTAPYTSETGVAASTSGVISSNANPSGPSVCILGGSGFIGRHLLAYLTHRKLASRITIADKALWQASYMNDEHKPLYEDKALVTFRHSDLTKDAHVDRIFKDQQYDYVFNLCGETRFGMKDTDYTAKCVETARKCSQAAVSCNLKKWIEVSTAQVYKSDKSASNESAPIKPWTMQAEKRLEAEKAVASVAGLPYIILRPAIVYGTGDLTGLTPRLSCASTYQASGEKMRFLWNDELRLNVVHVDDLVAAMWIAATESAPCSIYNLADQQDLTQGKLSSWIGQLFKIDVSCLGSLVSNLAKLNLAGVAEDANEKHVPDFTKLCTKHKILNTPISAYVDKELLRDNHLSVDGTRITRDTSFKYERQISYDRLKEQLDSFIQQGVFPPVV